MALGCSLRVFNLFCWFKIWVGYTPDLPHLFLKQGGKWVPGAVVGMLALRKN